MLRVHPFLCAIDDVVLAIFSLGSSGAKASDIGSGKCFGDGEGDEFLSAENGRNDLLADLGMAEV